MSAERLRNAGKTWLQAEREALREHMAQGMELEAIAEAHGRTAGAIVGKLLEMGLIIQNRDGFYFKVEPDPWSNWIEAKRIDGTWRDNPSNDKKELQL